MAEPRYPDDLGYHSEHLWARVSDDGATFGLTWFAQDSLGEVVFVSPGRIGDKTTRGTPFGDIESVKTVSDLYAPLSGEVVAINEGIADEPTSVNQDPYGAGWLIKVKLADASEVDELMNAADYQAMIKD
jgi:glycine cleavage system H protein